MRSPDANILQRTATFRDLDEPSARALMMCLRMHDAPAGTVLFHEGDPGSSMLLVAEGVLVAVVRDRHGVPQEINRMGPGETIGEMAFIDPAARSATVRALTDVAYYELDEDGLQTLQANARSAAVAVVAAVIRDVTRRLHRMDGLIAEELAQRSRARTARGTP